MLFCCHSHTTKMDMACICRLTCYQRLRSCIRPWLSCLELSNSIHWCLFHPEVLAYCLFDLICVRVSAQNLVWPWLVPPLLLFATCDSDVLYCPGHWGAGAKHLSMKSSGRFCFLSVCLIPGVPTTLLLLLILLLVLLVLFTGAVRNLLFAR